METKQIEGLTGLIPDTVQLSAEPPVKASPPPLPLAKRLYYSTSKPRTFKNTAADTLGGGIGAQPVFTPLLR